MIHRLRKFLIAGVVGASAAVAGGAAFAAAQASPQTAPAVQQTAADTPPSAVEDFDYPNADKILKEVGLKLRKGDGHIILADCNGAADLEVMANKDKKPVSYCFKVTGKSGYLTLEVPQLVGIWENEGRAAKATLTTEGKTKTVALKKNDLTELGEGDITTGAKEATLLELRVTG
ncbi:hypothetical protein ACFYWU_24495 [Streptomyces chrestomyceticus]|uniref:hypothetical protein n=1 Tax=Streptomyces chrestomyceticus TaxID=68185 RepID=UPI00367FBB4C